MGVVGTPPHVRVRADGGKGAGVPASCAVGLMGLMGLIDGGPGTQPCVRVGADGDGGPGTLSCAVRLMGLMGLMGLVGVVGDEPHVRVGLMRLIDGAWADGRGWRGPASRAGQADGGGGPGTPPSCRLG